MLEFLLYSVFWCADLGTGTMPVPKVDKPVVQKAYASPRGYHRHMDSRGNVWEHEDWNQGHVAPHLSPWTGELVWPKYFGQKAPNKLAGPTRQITGVLLPVQPASHCPT